MRDKLTGRARNALRLAYQETMAYRLTHVGLNQFAIGILYQSSIGGGEEVIRAVVMNLSELIEAVRQVTKGDIGTGVPMRPALAPGVAEILNFQVPLEAKNLGHNYHGTEHLLLALLKADLPPELRQIFDSYDLTYDTVLAKVKSLLGHDEKPSEELVFQDFSESNARQILAFLAKNLRARRVPAKLVNVVVQALTVSPMADQQIGPVIDLLTITVLPPG